MSRLPQPGADEGAWGTILNDFLGQAHNADGTIKSGVIGSGQLSAAGGSDGQILTKNSSATGGVSWSAAPSGGSAATSTTLGTIQLAGDLSGTATTPTVPALATKANSATTFTAGVGLTGGGDLSANRTLSANIGVAAGTLAAGDHTHTLTMSLTSFFQSGTLAVTTGIQYLPIDSTYTIVGTRLTVSTPAAGSSIIVDIKKNGVTIYTTQANRPTLAAGVTSAGPGATPDVTSLSAGDYLSVDIVQVGATTAGANLTVAIVVAKLVA